MDESVTMDETDILLKGRNTKNVIIYLVIIVLFTMSIVLFTDYDEDGLSNISEIIVHDTDFLELDTDRDGLDDKYELDHDLNPNSNDSDSDGLSDGREVKYVFSDPLNADTDNDSLSDGIEFNTLNTNPLVADSDGDNLSDYYETEVSLTNPNSADSDGDNLNDGEEINIHQTNPNMADSDGDSLDDGYEVYTTLSNPLSVDSDQDGIDDGVDVNPIDDVEIIIEFGFEGYLGDSFSGPDSYFRFYISHEEPIAYYLTTQIYVDTYSKSLDSSGSFSYNWDDSSELIYIIISGYDSDTWNDDERLDLGGADTSDIMIQLTYSSITTQWTGDYVSSYGTGQDASYLEGYPCDFSIRISAASTN